MPTDPNRSSVTVRIGGDEFVLRSTAEVEYTKRCAAHLDRRIRDARQMSGAAEVHRAAILAALSITDEYFRSQEAVDRLRREWNSRALNLARRVEGALAES